MGSIAILLALFPEKSTVELCHTLLKTFEPTERIQSLLVIVEHTYWGKKFTKSKFCDIIKLLANMKKSKLWKENVADLLLMHLNCDWFEVETVDNDFYENCTLLFRALFVGLHDMGKRLNTKFEGLGIF